VDQEPFEAPSRRGFWSGFAAVILTALLIVGLTGAGPVSHSIWLARPGAQPAVGVDEGGDATCVWRPRPGGKDVGTPPASGLRHSGAVTLTITTNLGVIEITADAEQTPCAIASLSYLARRHFFDNTPCSPPDAAGVVSCGRATGAPGYQFADENVAALPRASLLRVFPESSGKPVVDGGPPHCPGDPLCDLLCPGHKKNCTVVICTGADLTRCGDKVRPPSLPPCPTSRCAFVPGDVLPSFAPELDR
jgi:hypothetical protein